VKKMSDDFSQEPQQQSATLKNELSAKMAHIKGWAIDANPRNDPTYPMRRRFDADNSGYSWVRPALQHNTEGILKSNERPDMPGVFGTSAPASNLSGAIRRFAFQFSEGQYRHWLLLLLADRVNMIEGLVGDIFTGHVPHCLDERGLNAELKYNRKAVMTRVAVGTVVIASIALLLANKKFKQLP